MWFLRSAWIAEDQIWPYVKFKSKFMITQKIPQSFKEAVDAIEEELQATGDAATSDMVLLIAEYFYFLVSVIFCFFILILTYNAFSVCKTSTRFKKPTVTAEMCIGP